MSKETQAKGEPMVSDDDLAGWDRSRRYFAHDRETPQQVRAVYEAELSRLRAERDELVGEMRRHLWILQRAQADPETWEKLTVGTGIATLNGYEAVLSKHKPE